MFFMTTKVICYMIAYNINHDSEKKYLGPKKRSNEYLVN